VTDKKLLEGRWLRLAGMTGACDNAGGEAEASVEML